ncbi:histidine phosphatase family protein [Desulfobacter vibrioformis]|uniref:histidine phosphatase family protein n=1 Tax=Desulfobacter vibrioformis TaxID=34031 RepID=UPI00054FA18F|nr:phosphoglycerate mutase family protein [Desulfobacter vibrioformis]
MDLFLLRHMQTPDNKAGILQGRRDISILPPGPREEKLIRDNKLKLAPFTRFDHILVSGLKRTHETAAFYTDRFSVEPLLDELDFGPFEGRPRAELIRACPDWETNPAALVLGEPLSALKHRVLAFMDRYAGAKTVLAFGHGAWIRALTSLWETGNLTCMNRITIPNNTIVTISSERRKM